MFRKIQTLKISRWRWGYNDNKSGVCQTHEKKIAWVWGGILRKQSK
jgi:hypothetical protein